MPKRQVPDRTACRLLNSLHLALAPANLCNVGMDVSPGLGVIPPLKTNAFCDRMFLWHDYSLSLVAEEECIPGSSRTLGCKVSEPS
jgi:hypothetical protein